jgi:P4 family phage/plasmid primase-like protien
MTCITIPQQLIIAGARFIKVGKNSKAAIEKEWELNNYDAGSPALIEHLNAGGNYGVITRNGICVMDIDDPVKFKSIHTKGLPKSFTVMRGGGTSAHYYFKCHDCPDEMRTKIEVPWGDIRLGGNFYTVAPGCTAPMRDNPDKFLTYDVVNADPIAEVKWDTIKSLIERSSGAQKLQSLREPFTISETPGVGAREPTLHKLVWSLAGKGLFQESIIAACLVENSKFKQPHTEEEVRRIVAKSFESFLIKSEQRKLEKEQKKEEKQKEEIKNYGVTLNDTGNAIRMCSQYGKIIRHCEEWGKWFIWDGQRWKEDKNNTIHYLAKKVAKSIYSEASVCQDQKGSLELSKWAHESSNNSRLNAMVESCKSEHDFGIPITYDVLDRDPYLFNVHNGTIDLRTFEKLPHDQINLITKISPVIFDYNAKCPVWLSFLDRIFRKNPEKDKIIAFLKRSCGYSLTGDTREQMMFFLYGSGANGKSTFIDVIQHIMGDYAAATESNTFTTARGDSVRNDIARLVGMRFVSASENSTESLLDEALVKKLTGNEKISARFLHHEYFDFYPEFKIWWAFNHQPFIRDNTNSIWRRILLVPFEEIIPEKEQDKKLAQRLQAEAPGIFNWMLDGLREYYIMGINPPETVRAATQEYREEQDILHDFIKECCTTSETTEGLKQDLSIPASSLYNNYKSWYMINGGNTKDLISQTKFGRLLIELGFTRDRKTTGKIYHGLTLKK